MRNKRWVCNWIHGEGRVFIVFGSAPNIKWVEVEDVSMSAPLAPVLPCQLSCIDLVKL